MGGQELHQARKPLPLGTRRGALNIRIIVQRAELAHPNHQRFIEQPALFITGSRDPVARFMPAEIMNGWVTDLREKVVIEGAGHWIQQERPTEINQALLSFLGNVDY